MQKMKHLHLTSLFVGVSRLRDSRAAWWYPCNGWASIGLGLQTACDRAGLKNLCNDDSDQRIKRPGEELRNWELESGGCIGEIERGTCQYSCKQCVKSKYIIHWSCRPEPLIHPSSPYGRSQPTPYT
ncbi:hypothetical protein P153DRAFT_25283 [Dothidotthia symphoricarpi CBS 119687]|uniref:Uncharacterized protein n=1 Tax=Dothidotthia symphoricarpi CBS 119687 TaxID=1392245 RepID=A0A6A6ACY7_9PLEO|nr:uncharacterized protein P153DRAFT_25283 [Dothidotthia symphoricarpi CBS 119687]KAF2128778.1 hypothetical protein P153DRAFT_25283 [Dothidotthia symphoricarpi CBS 119687]